MVKPLTFKGDKKPKKRKRTAATEDDATDASAPPAKAPTTASDALASEDDDSWVTAEAVTDIAGPVTIILPTEDVSSLGSDANGVVFASKIENLVDGDPLTAEPHDVRQVWVANRVAGTEGFSFKGHNGKYVALFYTYSLHSAQC